MLASSIATSITGPSSRRLFVVSEFDTCAVVHAERFWVPPGPVRSGAAHHRLLAGRSAVVRRGHCSLGDARPQSHQVLGRQRPGRTTGDARSQVSSGFCVASARPDGVLEIVRLPIHG